MNTDALVLVLVALADLAFIVHLRRRHNSRARLERVTVSLRLAVRRSNAAADTEQTTAF